jgi:hypothetical protein
MAVVQASSREHQHEILPDRPDSRDKLVVIARGNLTVPHRFVPPQRVPSKMKLAVRIWFLACGSCSIRHMTWVVELLVGGCSHSRAALL